MIWRMSLQVITPSTSKGEYWLEAYPKTMADAGSFLKVHIIISEKDFLPKGLVVFDRNFKQGKNHSRTVFNFKKRETNFGSTLDKLNIFQCRGDASRSILCFYCRPGYRRPAPRRHAHPTKNAWRWYDSLPLATRVFCPAISSYNPTVPRTRRTRWRACVTGGT